MAMWRKSVPYSKLMFSSSLNPIFLAGSTMYPNPYTSIRIMCASSTLSTVPVSYNFNSSHSYAAFQLPTADSSSTIPVSFSKIMVVVDIFRHYGRCYWELSKARLSMLVVATSATGFVLGSGSAINFPGLCYTCLGTMMVAASANSLNQVFEKNNDAKMKRTMQRPLPSGRITLNHAITWASFVGLTGAALLACKANILAAGLGVSNLVLYAFIYTPLKQIHPVNTWVGSVVGAIPPLLGWAAASNQITLNGMLLPAALYFWQIPHFMALAYLCRADYAAGGFRMFSLTDPSGERTSAVALRNCVYLIPLSFLAYHCGVTSGWFCLESTLLTLAITASAFRFYRKRTARSARRMFHASLLYLPVFMLGLVVHRVDGDGREPADDLAGKEMKATEEFRPCPYVWWRDMDAGVLPPIAYASAAPFPFLPLPPFAPPLSSSFLRGR